MKLRGVSLGVALTAFAAVAPAAVTQSQFPPRTVRDLIAICAPAPDDPMMTAAINYCQGFAQGAVIVQEAHQNNRDARRLFCMPSPPPPSGSEISRFIAWANARPARLDDPAVDGMFIYLAETYPCPTTGGRKKESAVKRLILAGLVAALPLAGCADMTTGQQRALSGTAIGAGGGAIIGAIAGNAGLGAGIGAVAGLAGGLIYNKVKEDQAASYSAGYQAGATRQQPNPPQ